MRKALQTQRIKMMKQMRKKTINTISYTIIIGGIYYFGNNIFSEYHEIK